MGTPLQLLEIGNNNQTLIKMETIKFNACEHLDFSDNYSAKKDLISCNGLIKVCWNRPVPDNSYPALVQFCKKRGRLNSPYSCLCEPLKQCNDYNDIEHIVKIKTN